GLVPAIQIFPHRCCKKTRHACDKSRHDALKDHPMTDVVWKPLSREPTAWNRLRVKRDWLGLWFMLPAAAFLLLFLAYPLGLGIRLSFTDARIGRGGGLLGPGNSQWLLG